MWRRIDHCLSEPGPTGEFVAPDDGTRRQRSHRRAEHPRREFRRAEVERFAFGRLAGGHAQDEVEDPLAALLNGLVAVEDRAAIDVHVVLDMAEHRGVGRQLDRRRGLAAEHRASSGGETNQVGAARHLTGRGDRIVTGRVHEHEASALSLLQRIARRRRGWCCPPWPSRRVTFPGWWSSRRPCCRARDWRSSRRSRASCSPPTSASGRRVSRRPRATPRGGSAGVRRRRSPAFPTG